MSRHAVNLPRPALVLATKSLITNHKYVITNYLRRLAAARLAAYHQGLLRLG